MPHAGDGVGQGTYGHQVVEWEAVLQLMPALHLDQAGGQRTGNGMCVARNGFA